MHCPTTSHGTMRNININQWSAFAEFLILEQGIEGKKKAMGVYRRRFNKLVGWLNGKKFTRKNFVAFMAEHRAKGLKSSYLNNFIKTAKQIDKYLGTDEISGMKALHEQTSIPKDLLSPNEITKIAQIYIPYRYDSEYINTRQHALIMLLGTTGCRIDEALNLNIQDLHDSPPHVIFRDTKNGEDRAVPISMSLYSKLYKLGGINSHIFSGNRGSFLTQQAVNTDLKQRADACGITKRVYSHLFRHSYITEMIGQGVDWFVLSKIVGHKDPKTTLVYFNQSIAKASQIILLHPLLRPSLSFTQQSVMLKNEAQKICNRETATISIEEASHELIIRLKQTI